MNKSYKYRGRKQSYQAYDILDRVGPKIKCIEFVQEAQMIRNNVQATFVTYISVKYLMKKIENSFELQNMTWLNDIVLNDIQLARFFR